MKRIIFLIKLLFLTFCICSCSSKMYRGVITGEITEVKGQQVKCMGKTFIVKGTPPQIGTIVYFTPTKDSSIVNSKIVKP